MAITPKLLSKLRSLGKPAVSVYPIVIIILIPVLLAINTIWNLRSFNRDANFFIRHGAVSVADTLKPIISSSKDDLNYINVVLNNSVVSNQDILSLTYLVEDESDFVVYATTNSNDAEKAKEFGLNQLAVGFNQPFAGLTYDPILRQKVWNVVVPLETESEQITLLHLKLDTRSVQGILDRTTRDSIIVMVVLIIVTLILLANHFYFYLRSLKTQQLEELDKLKDEFISMAAHELRSPMTALNGYLDMLKDNISPEELPKIQSDLDVLDGLIKDLNTLINDLLDVSRLEQGRLKVEVSDVKINEIVQSVVTAVKPQASQKGLVLNFTPQEVPIIKSDPNRLKQVVTNLVNNSVKYTLKGNVTVLVTPKQNQVEVSVKDTGIGIPAEELPKLFGRFHRIQDKQTSEVRGTGLGLWITKQIVELLGGKIHAESIYGTGTNITFTIPIALS
jgi:signal transduction histidine kinase